MWLNAPSSTRYNATTLFHLPTHHNDWTWHPSPHSATGASIGSPSESLQIHCSPHKHNHSKTLQITVKLYNLRCKFRCSNAHPQHTIENRISKTHSTLMISSTYPGPPSMPRSVTLSKPKNKGKSYTTFLEPIVSAEWLPVCQIWLK